jgi:hypothetical protein
MLFCVNYVRWTLCGATALHRQRAKFLAQIIGRKNTDTLALARFLNQISETETHFDNMSKKIQSIYERRAMQIMLFIMDNGFGSECTDQERLDYFSAGFCSGCKAGGVEEDWIDEAFCEYEKKRQEKSVGAKNT